MTAGDSELRVRPGRIRHGSRGAGRTKTFVGQVMRAAKKAGHTGRGLDERLKADLAPASVAAAARRLPCRYDPPGDEWSS